VGEEETPMLFASYFHGIQTNIFFEKAFFFFQHSLTEVKDPLKKDEEAAAFRRYQFNGTICIFVDLVA
jgi:hypothetical protein